MSPRSTVARNAESIAHHRRRTAGAIWLAALAAPALAWALAAMSFEGADGDLVASTGTDWESFVGAPGLKVGHDAPTGQIRRRVERQGGRCRSGNRLRLDPEQQERPRAVLRATTSA